MPKKRMYRVKCLKCGSLLGYDFVVRGIEKCMTCHVGKPAKKRGAKQTASSAFAKTVKGPAKDLPGDYSKCHFRSGWERNFARVLCAEGKDWEYEKSVFTFTISPTSGKKYKTRPFIYIPDFHELSTGILWEVKGYLRSQDRSKMLRFKACYPEDFKRLRACLSKSNKKAIEFYKSINVPMIFIEDLRTKWKSKISTWEGK